MRLQEQAPLKLLGLLFVLVISYFQFKNWVLIHEENMQAVIGAAYGVFDGTPHWRAFQNRIFSPGLVYVLGFISDKPFILFMAAGIFALNAVLYGLVLHLTGSIARALLAVQGAVLMWIFQHHYWFYSWDLTEALCLLLFTYAALTEKMNRGALIVLILVSMLNKETAVLIGVYFMVRGAAERWAGRPINYKMIGQGVALAVASVIVTEALRHYLFKFSSLDGVGRDVEHATFGNHFNYAKNWETLMHFVQRPSAFFLIIVFYVTALISLVAHAIKVRKASLIGLSAALTGYALALWVFGVIDEYRIYQPLMWCVALLLVGINRRTTAG